MAELVDALVSGTSGATLGSSSLLIRTKNTKLELLMTKQKRDRMAPVFIVQPTRRDSHH